MPTWSILRGDGTTSTFADAFIGNVKRTLVNQAPDTAEVSFALTGLGQTTPFDPFEEIVILRDAVRWFVGRRPEDTPAAAGASESNTTTLYGPWWHLDHCIFMQLLNFVTSAAANEPIPSGESGLDQYTTQAIQTATIYLGEDANTARVNTQGMILAALNYAINKGAPFVIGTVDVGVDVAREEYRGVTCGDVVRRCLSWTPWQTVWFDYTTTPRPTINIRARENRAILTIDVADEEVEQVSIMQRRGEAEAGVRLEYLRVHERADFTFRTLDVDQAGPDPTGIGAMIMSIDLYGSYLSNGTVVAAETVPVGLAALLFAAYSVATFEGTAKLARQDPGTEAWTASRLSVLNGNPAWVGMATDIQSSVDTTFDGRTALTLGRPKHLGPQDLVNLVRRGRTQAPPTLAASLVRGDSASGGGSPATATVPSSSPDPRVLFGPHPPAVVLILRTYQANNGCTGQGQVSAGSVDSAVYHAAFGAAGSDTKLATDLLVGEIVDFHGTSVGRGSDVDYGLVGGTCFTLHFPSGQAPPTAKVWNVYGDGTKPSQ